MATSFALPAIVRSRGTRTLRALLQAHALAFVLLSSLAAGAAPAEPRLATKDEYLACLVAQSAIDAKKTRLGDSEVKLKERAAKFQAAEADLASQVKKHAPATNAEIESYNRAISARNASARSVNSESLALQKEQAALNELIFATNAQCGRLLVSREVAQAAEDEHRKMREEK